MRTNLKFFVAMGFALVISFTLSCQRGNNSTQSVQGSSNESVFKSSEPHFDEVIAFQNNGEIVFVSDIDSKIWNWVKLLKKDGGLDVSFYDVFIEQNNGTYTLTGKDSILPATSKIKLVLENGNFYEAKYFVNTTTGMNSSSGGTSATCSGCKSTGPGSASECQPKENENGWYCTDCSKGECVKTVSFQSGGILK